MFSLLVSLINCKHDYKGATLIIIDGLGESAWMEGNGIANSNKPFLDKFKSDFISTSLVASQQPVGLISGEKGSSGVGHQTLGLGRTIPGYLQSLEKGLNDESPESLYNQETLRQYYKKSIQYNSRVHFAGLCTDKGVFSHIKFLEPMFRAAKDENVTELLIHCFFNSAITNAPDYLKTVESYIPNGLNARIAQVHHGKTSLDRVKNWGLTNISYKALSNGEGTTEVSRNQLDILLNQYASTSSSYNPLILEPKSDNYLKDNDVLIFFQHREDQSYQLVERFVTLNSHPSTISILPMILYDISFINITTILPTITYQNSLGSWISKQGKKQLRTSEAYKKYHISDFFSGGITQPIYEGEDRVIDIESVDASLSWKYYQMNATKVYEAVEKGIASEKYTLIAANFVNIDATGHTGNATAVKLAIEYLDGYIKKIWELCEKHNYVLFITADHGNGDENTNLDGSPQKDHTINNVPFLTNSKGYKLKQFNLGKAPYLGNVAPTILQVLGMSIPPEMEPPLLEEIFPQRTFPIDYDNNQKSNSSIYGLIYSVSILILLLILGFGIYIQFFSKKEDIKTELSTPMV